jgi:glycosyltransferase involved in cell wall biosynthesis
MRIALFHTTLPELGRKVSGVEVAVHRLANELTKNADDEVTVFSLSPRPVDATYQHKQVFKDARALLQGRATRLSILPFLLNFVRFEHFDVVHLHGDDWFYVRRTTPTVRTLHGSALREANSAASYKRKLVQYWVYPLEHVSARLATIPLAVGTDAAAIYGVSEVVDCGVDLQLFSPGAKAATPRILFVGTWEGRKRGRFLFDVFTDQVLSVIPHAELYMVSDYCPIHPNVVDVRLPRDEILAELMRTAWVFAFPSTYEGFGMPYLEALASGTAVLSSPNDGAKYILADGTYGVIAEDVSFGKRLIKLLRDDRERKALETSARSRAEQFSWATVAARHREVYIEAISRSEGVDGPNR